MTSYEESYVGQLRKLAGERILLTPGVRGLIHDEDGRILFIRRRDNGKWGMSAGSVELNETVFEPLKREVEEETRLHLVSATPIAIYSRADSPSREHMATTIRDSCHTPKSTLARRNMESRRYP